MTDHLEINKVFEEIYISRYSSDHNSIPTNYHSIFDGLNTPSIEQAVTDKLEEALTIKELNVAMTSLQSGPDSYLSEI